MQKDSLQYWRERILGIALVFGSTLGLLAYIPSILISIMEGIWIIVVADSIVYGAIVVMLFKRDIPFKIKAGTITFLTWALAVVLLSVSGTQGVGLLWLFAFPIVAGVLLGLLPSIIALGVNALSLAVFGILQSFGILIWSHLSSNDSFGLIVLGINFMVLNGLITMSVSALVRGLKSTVVLERFSSRRLQQNREQIIKTNEYLKEEMEERRRIEKALRLNEEKYRLLVELSSDAIFFMTVSGIILDCNAATCKIFGYDREELLGLDVRRMIPDKYVHLIPDIITEEVTTGDIAAERLYKKKDGNVFPTEIITKVFEVGGEKRVLAYVRDITERKTAEAELRESEKKFRNLAENVPGTIYMCNNDKDFSMIYLNDQAEEISGYPKEEFLEERISFADLYHPEDKQSIYEEVDKAVAEKRPFHLNYRIRNKSGEWRWIEEYGVGVFDESGNNLMFLEGFFHDITARKKAEEGLRESEERLKLALEATSDGLWDWDIATGKAYFGPRYYTMLGYEPGEFESTFDSWVDMVHPEDREEAQKTLQWHIKNKEGGYEIEFRLRAKDGRWHWILSRGKVVERDANGIAVRIIGTHVDITARKEAEEEIKSQAAFAHNNPSPVIQARPNGKIIRYNPSAQQLFEDKLSMKNIFNVFPELKELCEDIENNHDTLQFEHKFREQVMLFTLKKDEATNSLYIYGIDISARKRAEQAQRILLEISETANEVDNLRTLLEFVRERLGTLLDTGNFYVALYNPENDTYNFPILIDENEGLEPESLPLGNSMTDYVRRIGKPVLIDAETQKAMIEAGEIDQLGPPSAIWLGVPLKTSNEVSGVMAIQNYQNPRQYTNADLDLMTFVSGPIAMVIERKRTEDQRQKLQEKLERAERMESLGILAGGVAHDLNNMLGPMVGYPDLILQKLPEDSPVIRHVERISSAANDAADVIQDLLTLARRGRYEMHPLNLNDVVESYLDTPSFAKVREGKPYIRLDIDLDRSISNVMGSKPHLSKVIMNLVVNAYDAMGETGSLEISTSMEYIEKLITAHFEITPGQYIVLRVKDTGSGIDQKELDKIFEPYFSKKKMGASGSGLGLSVVHGIIKDHKGYYDVISEIGKGTEFMLYFPVTDQKEEVEKVTDSGYGGREKILVVDDAEEQRKIASALLKSIGYQVATAKDGYEAVEYIRKNKVDIAVIDMIMEPGFGGLETYHEILKINPKQKAIIVSGYSKTEDVVKMQHLGAGSYIKKPYNRETLARAVRQELDKKPQKIPQ
ncbi:MAG: PAS domain S-box protein [candidate division Zixibacteria bacterium]|nr:PAS domain S-box protein [candidate division Zixibacteria bacterium]